VPGSSHIDVWCVLAHSLSYVPNGNSWHKRTRHLWRSPQYRVLRTICSNLWDFAPQSLGPRLALPFMRMDGSRFSAEKILIAREAVFAVAWVRHWVQSPLTSAGTLFLLRYFTDVTASATRFTSFASSVLGAISRLFVFGLTTEGGVPGAVPGKRQSGRIDLNVFPTARR
jgi:hypothetical protein